jgi:hypothetical protein
VQTPEVGWQEIGSDPRRRIYDLANPGLVKFRWAAKKASTVSVVLIWGVRLSPGQEWRAALDGVERDGGASNAAGVEIGVKFFCPSTEREKSRRDAGATGLRRSRK